jgi:hypothetical protein
VYVVGVSGTFVSVRLGSGAAGVVGTKADLADGCECVGTRWVAKGGEPIFCNPRIDAGDAMKDVACGDTGMVSRRSPLGDDVPTLEGLGLLLLRLPMGLAKPLLRSTRSWREAAGETTATSSFPTPARMVAALSKTDGTDCSSCSVPLERGIL